MFASVSECTVAECGNRDRPHLLISFVWMHPMRFDVMHTSVRCARGTANGSTKRHWQSATKCAALRRRRGKGGCTTRGTWLPRVPNR